MSSLVRRSMKYCLRFATVFVLSAGAAFATTVTIAAGTGTLTFSQTLTVVQAHCVTGGTAEKDTYRDTGFSYKDANGVITGLSGAAVHIDNECYGSSTGEVATLQSTQLNVVFDNRNDPDGVVTGFQPHGYINPKYAILGVTYAPPGPSSYVNYLNSTTLSSTADTKSTFSNLFQTIIKTKVSGSILGWFAGSTTTSTSAYTQASFTSSSVTVSKTTSLSDQTPGPSSPYVGLNHDYDIIWLWLNPVQAFTLVEDTTYKITSVEWDGYGFSTLDPAAGMEVYPVYVGWLNGDIAMTPDQAKPLQRAWAAGETWPSGQGPALTSTGTSNDFQAIVKSDLYWQCTPLPSACPTTVDGTRYTLTLNQNLVYLQAPVGGQPITQTYTDSYTQSSTQGHGASYEYAQTFAWENTYKASLFQIGFETTLSVSNTTDWKDEWDQSLTNSNTQTATASITGPPCVVSGSSCNPVYTKSTEFDLYEDNLYGTFLFFPIN